MVLPATALKDSVRRPSLAKPVRETAQERQTFGLFTPELQDELYAAKCQDLKIVPSAKQKERFLIGLETQFGSRRADGQAALDLRSAGYGLESAKVLARILANSNYYTHASLGGNQFQDEGIMILSSSWLSSDRVLRYLDFRSTGCTPAGLAAVCTAMIGHESLEELDLGAVEGRARNRLGMKGAQAVCSLILHPNCHIRTLRLSSVGVTDQILAVLAHGFTTNQTIDTLDLAGNSLDASASPVLAEAIQGSSIRHLHLENNNLRAQGVTTLALTLLPSHPLTSLYLANNHIGALGAAQIARVLGFSCYRDFMASLANWERGERRRQRAHEQLQNAIPPEMLNDSYEKFESREDETEAPVEEEAQPRPEPNSVGLCALERLDLSLNELGDEGASLLAEGLAANSTLIQLRLAGNKIGVEGGTALGRAFASDMSQIEDIDLSTNNLGDDGCSAVIEGIRARQVVRRINLSANRIGDLGGRAVAATIVVSQTLQSVNLRDNLLGNDSCKPIVDAVQARQDMTMCDIQFNRCDYALQCRLQGILESNTLQQQINSEKQLNERIAHLQEGERELTDLRGQIQAERWAQMEAEDRIKKVVADLMAAHRSAIKSVEDCHTEIDDLQNQANQADKEARTLAAECSKIRAAGESKTRLFSQRANRDTAASKSLQRKLANIEQELEQYRKECPEVAKLMQLRELRRRAEQRIDEAELLELERQAWEQAIKEAKPKRKSARPKSRPRTRTQIYHDSSDSSAGD